MLCVAVNFDGVSSIEIYFDVKIYSSLTEP